MQKNTYCTCGGSHISPDRKVDASSGYLCETTFFFDEGNHESTARNDVIIGLAVELLTDENFTDVHTYPDRYPQFNTARDTKKVRQMLETARKVDVSTLSAADADELKAAITECEAMLAETVVDLSRTEHAQERLSGILIKLGREEAPQELSARQTALAEIMMKLSRWAYSTLGARGFSDVLLFRK